MTRENQQFRLYFFILKKKDMRDSRDTRANSIVSKTSHGPSMARTEWTYDSLPFYRWKIYSEHFIFLAPLNVIDTFLNLLKYEPGDPPGRC